MHSLFKLATIPIEAGKLGDRIHPRTSLIYRRFERGYEILSLAGLDIPPLCL
jgi:hypothetical protein